MPSYTVTDPRTGRKATLTGDAPPTEVDLDHIFASAPANDPSPISSFDDIAQSGEAPKPIDPKAADWKEDFRPQRTLAGTAGDIGITALKGAVGLPQAFVGLGDIASGGQAGKSLEEIGYRPNEAKRMLDEGYSPAQQAANKEVHDAKGFVGTLKALRDNPSVIATTVGESLPQILGGVGMARGLMGLAPKVSPLVAGAAGEGVMGAGSAAEQIREQTDNGLLTPEQSGAALASGVITGGLGVAGGKLARKFGLDDIDTSLAGGGAARAAMLNAPEEVKRNFAVRLVGSGISEGVFEELPQSMQEQMWQNFATDRPLDEGVAEAGAMGMAAGAATGSGFSVGNAGMNAARDRATQQQEPSEAEQAFLNESGQPQQNISDGAVTDLPQPQLQNSTLYGDDATVQRQPVSPQPAAPQTQELHKTADEIEGELLSGEDIDTQIAALMGDFDSLRSRGALPAPNAVVAPDNTLAVTPSGVVAPRVASDQLQTADSAAIGQTPEAATNHPAYAGEDTRNILDQENPVTPPEPQVPESDLSAIRQNAAAERAKNMRLSQILPPGFDDPRLARDEYRQSLQGLGEQLTVGGDIGYTRDANDNITGRTSSINPDWFKGMNEDNDHSMSVEQTQAAIKKALAGEKLGVRQARVVKRVLDEVGGIRSNYATHLREQRQEAKRTRHEALKSFWDEMPDTGNDPFGIHQENVAELFNEDNYEPEASYDDRSIAEMAAKAESMGADWRAVDKALESGDSAQSIQALSQLIYGLRNEHRPTATRTETGREAAGDIQPGDSAATIAGMERESADAAQPAEGRQAGEIAPTVKDSLAVDRGNNTSKNNSIGNVDDMSVVDMLPPAGSRAIENIDAIANEAATSPNNDLPEPTQAQKEAGNYRKGHVRIHGLDIAIENPHGSTRRGVDKNGKAWESTMHGHYGYVKRTLGADGDAVDVFIGNKPESQKVFVIDQYHADGTFDEHKAVMATGSMLEAKSLYKRNYQKGWKVGPATAMSADEFKAWLKDGDTTKPLATPQKTASKPLKPESDAPQGESETPKPESGHRQTKATEEAKSYGGSLFDDPKYSLGDTGSAPVSQAEVAEVIKRVSANFGAKLKITPVASAVELPPEVLDNIQKQKIDGDKVRGVYHSGEIFINREAMQSAADVEATILHELAHDGLAKMFGPSISRKMTALFFAIGGLKGLNQLTEKYNVPVDRYEEALADHPAATRVAIMTEELLAHIAQDNNYMERKPGLKGKIADFVLAVKTWLRLHGFLSSSKMGEDEIFALLRRVRKYSDGSKGTRYSLSDSIGDEIEIDGVVRPTTNSNGQKIHHTEEGIKNFWRWFGESKVVDGRGRPFVVYHGTTSLDKIMESGFKKRWAHLTDSKPVADSYQQWKKGGSAGTLELYVRVENPANYDAKGEKYTSIGNKVWRATDSAEESGRDGIIIENIRDNYDSSVSTKPHLTVVVFDPSQIKSATDNAGEFNSDNPDIRYSLSGDESTRPSGGFSISGAKKVVVDAFKSEQRLAADRARETLPGEIRDSLDRLGDARNIRTRVRDGVRRWLTPSGLLPKDVHKLKLERDGQLNGDEFHASIRLQGFYDAVKEGYQKEYEYLVPATKARLNQAMRGEDVRIPEQVKTAIAHMRDQIKRLSAVHMEHLLNDAATLEQQGDEAGAAAKLRLADTIAGNFETYLHRSYRAFDDPDWPNKVRKSYPEIYAAAVNYLANGYAKSDQVKKYKSDRKEARKKATSAEKRRHFEQMYYSNHAEIQQARKHFNDLKRELSDSKNNYSLADLANNKKDKNKYEAEIDKLVLQVREANKNLTKIKNAAAEGATESFRDNLASVTPSRENLDLAKKKVALMLEEGTAFDSLGAFISESKLGAKDLSIIKKRKTIAPEILALLGEYEDAPINYTKSVAKMSRLVYNHAFLSKLRELGFESGLFSDSANTNLGHNKKIAGDASEAYAPLNGLYTSHEFHQALIDAMGRETQAWWYRQLVSVNGMVKFGKTVLSPTTALRNLYSAMFFSLTNGHFDFSKGKNFSWSTYFNGKPDALAYMEKLRRLGVVYDNPYAGEMMALLKDSRLDETVFNWKPFKWTKTGIDYAQKFYGFGDDLWKIIGFENEKAMLIKHKGMSEAAAEVEAAERIRNTYPTYSLIPKAVNSLRRFPLVGTFVSFPAEVIRTSYHIVRYFGNDIRELGIKNPMVQRKAVGLLIAGAAMFALQAITKALVGVDDDEEKALRLMSPPWQKNSNLAYLGRDDKGALQTMDMSFLDPYGYWKRPINALLQDQPLWDAIKSGIKDLWTPFFGQDITFGAIMDVTMNQKDTGGRVFNPQDTVVNQALDISGHIAKAIQPGIVSNITRMYMAATGKVTASGKKFDVGDELAALAGFRWGTFDPKTALYYQTFSFTDTKADASRVLADALKDPNAVSEGELKDAFDTAMRARKKAYERMGTMVSAAEKSGLTKFQVLKILKDSGLSRDDSNALANGRVPEWKPAKSKAGYNRAKILFSEEVGRELKAREQLVNKWRRE